MKDTVVDMAPGDESISAEVVIVLANGIFLLFSKASKFLSFEVVYIFS